MSGPFLSHLRSLMGCDEPEILLYAITPNCFKGADGGNRASATSMPFPGIVRVERAKRAGNVGGFGSEIFLENLA